MFGRATITLGIGPHSISIIIYNVTEGAVHCGAVRCGAMLHRWLSCAVLRVVNVC